jgi:hypothetical protein
MDIYSVFPDPYKYKNWDSQGFIALLPSTTRREEEEAFFDGGSNLAGLFETLCSNRPDCWDPSYISREATVRVGRAIEQ